MIPLDCSGDNDNASADPKQAKQRPWLHLTAAFTLMLAAATVNTACPPPSGEGEGEGEGQATFEITLPPDADTTLFESSTGNLANGAGQYLFTGRTAQGFRRRALLHFDLSSIPPTATVTDARLRLHISRSIAGTVAQNLLPAPAGWGEGASDAPDMEGTGTTPQPGDATWLHTFFPDNLWPTPGGGTFAPADAHATLDASEAGTYEFTSSDLIADLQAWISGSKPNFGWILLGDETAITTAKRWDSRENPTPANRPALVITYQP